MSQSVSDEVRVGVDIGGTFTDILAFDPDGNTTWMEKVPSTPSRPARGVVDGLERLFDRTDLDPGNVATLSHGSTVTINTLIEHTGAETALLVTEGFSGVPLARHGEKPDTEVKNPRYRQPDPYVPQDRVYDIPERVTASGEVRTPLDEEAARDVIRELRDADVESAAVGLLFSFLNPVHERRLAELFDELYPACSVSLSSDLAPRIREYPRLSTTTVSAYVDPILGGYLDELAALLAERDITPESLSMMLSHGGLTSFEAAADRPIGTVLSGPAAGVQGALHAARSADIENIVTMDMGGTSCDVAIAPDREPVTTTEMEIQQNPISIPLVDVQAIGAGGGTIAREEGGRLRVGPQSAGADPGPVCYGEGGERVTVTDANAVLGRLNPDAILGGGLEIDLDSAVDAVRTRIAEPLDLSVTEAAAGVIAVVNDRMKKELSLTLTQRGYDPRNFALIVYGGAGPMHAPSIARELNIERVVVPPRPGINSAVGLLATDRKRLYERSRVERLSDAPVEDVFERLRAEALADIEGVAPAEISFERELELRYAGQSYELGVAVPDAPTADELRAAFDEQHREAYGHVSDQAVETMTYRLTATIETEKLAEDSMADDATAVDGDEVSAAREAYFDGAFQSTPVYARDRLDRGTTISGPAIVEQTDTTVIVEPDMTAEVGSANNLILTIE